MKLSVILPFLAVTFAAAVDLRGNEKPEETPDDAGPPQDSGDETPDETPGDAPCATENAELIACYDGLDDAKGKTDKCQDCIKRNMSTNSAEPDISTIGNKFCGIPTKCGQACDPACKQQLQDVVTCTVDMIAAMDQGFEGCGDEAAFEIA